MAAAAAGAAGGSAGGGDGALHRALNGRQLKLATKLAHCEGYVHDEFAGSMPPIHQSATFQQPDAVREAALGRGCTWAVAGCCLLASACLQLA